MQSEIHGPDLQAFGQNLRQRRIALRLTQQELGEYGKLHVQPYRKD